MRLGGRAAELVLLGEGSTGAADDLAGATQVATRMVCEFGLSAELGPVGYSDGNTPELGAPGPGGAGYAKPYSERTQALIDQEVSRLLRAAESRALDLLREHVDALQRLAATLVEQETLDGAAVLDTLAATAVAVP